MLQWLGQQITVMGNHMYRGRVFVKNTTGNCSQPDQSIVGKLVNNTFTQPWSLAQVFSDTSSFHPAWDANRGPVQPPSGFCLVFFQAQWGGPDVPIDAGIIKSAVERTGEMQLYDFWDHANPGTDLIAPTTVATPLPPPGQPPPQGTQPPTTQNPPPQNPPPVTAPTIACPPGQVWSFAANGCVPAAALVPGVPPPVVVPGTPPPAQPPVTYAQPPAKEEPGMLPYVIGAFVLIGVVALVAAK